MTSAQNESQALGASAARQLANATKTVPQLSTITPRWLLHLLSWVPVEAGIYRVNRVVNPERVAIHAEEGGENAEDPLPQTYVDYETSPRELTLRAISTLLDVHTRVSESVLQPTRPGHPAAAVDHRDHQGAPGVGAGQQPRVRPAVAGDARADDSDAHRGAHPRRPGRIDHQGVEDAQLLLYPSAGRRRLRPRGHLPRRAAGGGQPVRGAVHHLAHHPDRPV